MGDLDVGDEEGGGQVGARKLDIFLKQDI